MAEIKPIQVLVNGEMAGKTIKELRSSAASLGAEINKLEPGSEAWIKKTQEFSGVKNRLALINEESRKLQDQMKGLDLSKFGTIGGILQGVKQQFTDLKGGFGSVIQSLGVVKTAVAATGIGFLVIAFMSLVAYFQKTDEGAMKLDGIMRGIGATVDILTNLLLKAGKILFSVFENPKKAATDLMDFIGNNLMNRVKAFGVIWESIVNMDFKKAADGVIQLGTGIEGATDKAKGLIDSSIKIGQEIAKAAKEAMDLAAILDGIDDKRRETELATAQNEKVIARLLLQSKNRTTSDKERIAILEQASKIELENHKMQLSLNADNIMAVELELAQKIKAANAEVDLRGKTNAKLIELAKSDKLSKGTLSDEDLDKYNQVLIARESLDQKSIEVQEKITNRREALEQRHQLKMQKAEEARIKKADEARKKLEEQQKAELDAQKLIADKAVNLIENETERKAAALRNQAKQETDAANASKATADQKAVLVELIEKNLTADLTKLKTDSIKAAKELDEKAAKEDLDLRRRHAQAAADLEVAIAQGRANQAASGGDDSAKLAAGKALMDAQIAAIQTKAQFELESTANTEAEKQLIIQNSQNQIDQIRQASAQAEIERSSRTAQSIVSGFSQAFSAIQRSGEIESQNSLKRLDRDKAARIKSLDDEFKKGKISKEAYEKSKSDIESGFADQTRSIKQEQAQKQKQWAIAQAIMQGILAVLAASANPLGIFSPTAIATAAFSAINVAQVAATDVPEFSRGGRLPRFGKGGIPEGPSHSNGGLKIIGQDGRAVAEIEGGEPILSRATYRNNPELVNMLLDSSMNRGGAAIYVDPGLLRSYKYETGGILPGGGAGSGSGAGDRSLRDQLARQHQQSMEQAEKLFRLTQQQHMETLQAINRTDTLLKAYVVTSEVADSLNEIRSLKREARGDLNDGSTASGEKVALSGDLF